MKRKIILVTLSIGVFSVWYGVAQFTEKRIKKGPSMATLKEQCCLEFGEVLKLVPDMLRKAAALQEKSIEAINGYWQGDKESFCNVASLEKITKCRARLEMVREKISVLCKEADSCIATLNAA